MEVFLFDKNPEVIKAFHHFFDRSGKVEIKEGDILEAENIDAVVVPINSFGILDSGFAEQLNKRTDGMLEGRVRKLILEKHGGELSVGGAEVMTSGLEAPMFVVLSPTVRVPMRMNQPGVNPYLATRAALRAVAAFIRNGGQAHNKSIDSLGFVGMGTGEGGVPPATAAFQMYEAFCQVVMGQVPNFATLEAATAHDQELRKNRFM